MVASRYWIRRPGPASVTTRVQPKRLVRELVSGERGEPLIEVLVSALIVALLATAVAIALIAGADTDSDQRDRSQASELAQLDQERMKGLSALQLTDLAPPNQEVRTVYLGGIPYTITSTANFLSSTGGSACGSTGAGAAAYYQVISQVTWGTNHRGPVTIESQITPPAGGTLLTQVEDPTGAGIAGVGVSATGEDEASGTTDTAGCEIFSGLDSGDYTLALTDPGYVTDNGVPADPVDISATVTSTGTATPSSGNPIRLGLAGDVSANFVTGTNGSTVGQEADALSWYGAGQSDSMSAFACGDLTGTSTACPQNTTIETPGLLVPATGVEQLYPFYEGGGSYTGNYHIWSGQCRAEEPPSGTDTFTISPGSTQALAIQEPEMNIKVDYNGSQVTPSDIVMEFQSTLGASCTDVWSVPVAPAIGSTPAANALADPGQPFASNSTTTNPSASGYTGTITVCADYRGRYAEASGLTNTSYSSLPSATTITIPTGGSANSCSNVM